MAKDSIKPIVDTLWKDPQEKTWAKFAVALKKSNLKYYSVHFEKENKLKKLDDLRGSYVGIYGGDQKLVYKVPLIQKTGKKIRGATIYLINLLNLNKE